MFRNIEGATTFRGLLAAVVSAAAGAGAAGLTAWLLIHGLQAYGAAAFLGVPFLAGFVSVAVLRFSAGPQPRRSATLVGLAAGVLLVLGFLLLGAEGCICIAMTLPLSLPFTLAGVEAAYRLFHRGSVPPELPGAAAMIAVSLLGLAEARQRGPAPSFLASDSILVAASPERIWNEIVGLERMPEARGVLLRTGLACPREVRIARAGKGGTRVCRLSTGPVVERIDAWDPGRRLHWTAASTPPPLTELNPFAAVDAPHLHGFYEAYEGEFALEPAPGGATRLIRRTWYRHNLAPAWYWRLWCDLGARQIHLVVLRELQRLAERPVGSPASHPERRL